MFEDLFFGDFLVVLAERNSNKYDSIIRFKQSVLIMNNFDQLENPSSPAKKVNEYGETVVGKVIQKQKHLTEEEIVLLVSEYKTGKSTYVLADQFGCHRSTVSSILKKHGVKVTHCKSKEKLNIQDAISMYENLHTAQEIADKYGVTRQMVTQSLHAHGVKIRSRRGISL